MPPRVLSLCLALTLLLGCGAAAPVTGTGRERPAVQALELLRRWDARRAAAYASGDPHRLRKLYVPGSRAGARDVRLLRSYAERGLVVEELTVQVLDVRLVSASPSSVRLQVLDRVVGGSVVGGRVVGGRVVGRRVAPASGSASGSGSTTGDAASLPAARPVSRVVMMVEHGGGWVVRSVRRG